MKVRLAQSTRGDPKNAVLIDVATWSDEYGTRTVRLKAEMHDGSSKLLWVTFERSDDTTYLDMLIEQLTALRESTRGAK